MAAIVIQSIKLMPKKFDVEHFGTFNVVCDNSATFVDRNIKKIKKQKQKKVLTPTLRRVLNKLNNELPNAYNLLVTTRTVLLQHINL